HVLTLGASLTISGSDHSITFAKDDPGLIDAAGNALTFEDVVLRDFSPSSLSLSGGSVLFGDGTTVEMSDNTSLLASDYTMSFDGYTELNCFGNEFDISQMEHAMDVLVGSTLVINNARIKGLGGSSGTSYINNLKCLGPDSTLALNNCELLMEDNYSFTEGYLSIYQDTSISGPENPAGTPLVFAYQSPQVATIHSTGKLMLDRYITFSYDPPVAQKDLLVMEDATSILHLNGCTLFSTATGLELTGGRLIVEDKVTIQNDATSQSEAMVLKDPLEIDVLSGGVFDLTLGLLEYQ
ncbi:hypothetical protein KAU11_02035, partial [Candidatus Babeliales bacterium]|nr:hypothetical protein [Candidatus Babeliales bacterium]